MTALALALCTLLSQAAEPAPADAPAAAPAPAPAPATVRVPAYPKGMVSPEEVNRQLERIKSMAPEHRAEAEKEFAEKIAEHSGAAKELQEGNTPLDIGGISSLPEPEQVKLMSRMFVGHIISGDARGLVLLSAYPFQLEDRKLATPEELHKEWLKNLRPKRTDALTLYDIEVLGTAEMEKKYGRPPARLANLPLRGGKTYLAVVNLSGHAAVIVWRLFAHGWEAVGYTD